MKTTKIPVSSILLHQTKDELIQWFEEEKTKVRFRFGSDPEALKYFPDNYYEKLEKDWQEESVRIKQPLDLIQICDKFNVNDGWHRLAISLKYNHDYVYGWTPSRN